MAFVGRLQNHDPCRSCYPSYGAPTLTPVGLSPTGRASLRWTHNGGFGVARRRRVDSRHRGHPSQCGPEPVIYLDRFDFQLAVIGIAVSMPKEWANGSAMPFV